MQPEEVLELIGSLDWEWDPDPLSWGADEYEVLVDTERGVLMRCASREPLPWP